MPERMEVKELERKFSAAMMELDEIDQILGEALGYPRYMDDPTNFPEATEEDGFCTGEHTATSLAMEAAEKLQLIPILKQLLEIQGEQPDSKLRAAAIPALAWIDAIYPPDIFIGKSEDADEGVKQIAKIREDLREALKSD